MGEVGNNPSLHCKRPNHLSYKISQKNWNTRGKLTPFLLSTDQFPFSSSHDSITIHDLEGKEGEFPTISIIQKSSISSSDIKIRVFDYREEKKMKVHPAPRKRHITLHYDIRSPITEASRLICRQKKLRRLPHIFAKVIELPFHSDAEVSVEETDDFFRFTVCDTDVSDDVRADTIEIYPGVTKIVVRSSGGSIDLSIDGLELDLWRFRLPSCTRPELATANFLDGDLLVTVPKGAENLEVAAAGEERESWSGGGNLVLVQ